MMDLHEQLKDIKTQLRLSMNGAVSQSMREKGLVYKLNFGVELPRIKGIAAAYEKDHTLAQALWKEDIRWIADERELAQVCGFLTIARLLQKKGDMEDRVANEFLDQAVSCFLTGSYAVRNAVSAALRRFMEHSEEHAFRACRCVDGMKDSSSESERLLYEVVSAVIE